MLIRFAGTMAVLFSCGYSFGAFSQPYPSRPIRLVVPYVASGGVDLVSRVVAEGLTSSLGRQMIVDNRGGAAGVPAYSAVAGAAPDGYTLITAADTITVLPSVYRKLTFDPQKSFAPITLMSAQPFVLVVHTSVPASTFKEFVALAKAKPGTLSFATAGAGTTQHLSGELIKQKTGIDLTHVPYKGGGQAIVDVVGGQVPAAVLGVFVVSPHVRTGKLRMLAVTSAKRSPLSPNTPTLAESGLAGMDVYQWTALMAPAGTPKEVVARLNAETRKVLSQAAVRERLEVLGFEATPSSSEELQALIREGQARWSKLIGELGLKVGDA
jgi:tripartite-type tricarboxylate transporter receptor subunit TctC